MHGPKTKRTRETTFGRNRVSPGASQHPEESAVAAPVGKTNPEPAPAAAKPKKKAKAK
jgi:hypothetical protein